MRTTSTDRSKALRLSSAVLAGYTPDRPELELMAATIEDCASAFRERLAPVYRAALLAWDGSGYERWHERRELQRIVQKCRAWEREFGELPEGEK